MNRKIIFIYRHVGISTTYIINVMAYRYETKSLYEIYNMLDSKLGNRSALIEVAEMAYFTALKFQDIVTKEWIVAYLNDDLPMDSLSYLSLVASVLYKDDGLNMFSLSHSHWLSSLRQCKLGNKHMLSIDDKQGQDLYEAFLVLQKRSMSFEHFISETHSKRN